MRRPSLSLSALPVATIALLTFALRSAGATPDKVPLHDRIDPLVEAGMTHFQAKPAALAPDAEFLRRVWLDLAGTIPTAAEAWTFLQDPSPNKREKLVDRLLASPTYARHLRDVFDVLLTDRRTAKHVPRAEWREFLRKSFEANKPWDQLVREILEADGADPKRRAAAKFYLDREGEPNLVTRDVGRLFLGMNLQCAQCHDHPLVPAYKQDFYQGIFAFLNRSYLFGEANKPAVFAEKAEGEVSFQSVFDPAKATKTTGPRLPGRPQIKEPKFDKGKEYVVAPAKGIRPVPRFSRRAQLAAEVTDRGNVRFRRNGANRLWALLTGRGLVHPPDLDHDNNPPSHPELLTVLADDFAAHDFDMRYFLRELALTKAYQRASELPAGVEEVRAESFAVANLKPLSPEQLAWSLMQATGLVEAEREAHRRASVVLALLRVMALRANGTDVPVQLQASGYELIVQSERASPIESALRARLEGKVAPFAAIFGGKPGQSEGAGFEATIDQTLFLSNGPLVRSWLAPRPGNLLDRLLRLNDAKAIAEELYLSVLTRLPSAEESREVADYLQGRTKDRPAAVQELIWALLASAEFRFNH